MNNNILDIPLHEKVGQLFCPAAYINDTAENIKEIENLILNHHIGGLTFFHSRTSAATNFEGKKNVVRNENSAQRLSELIQHYQKLSKFPLLISIDAEWGLAMRVENTPQYPYAITLGALSECDNYLVFEVAKNIGNDLRQLGINYNLAPVVDINDNPKNPVIGYRSFGTDANNVTLKAIEFCNGLQQAGILSCLKHFPGHGNTSVDSHLGLPIINKTKVELENVELYPFAKIIQNNIVESVMIGHLAVPALTNGKIVSATLSSEIIQDLLRKQFKFNGLVISDALNMHSVSKLYPTKGVLELKAFEAGNDFLCFSENV
ncbi:MAG: glycoside hydrolase family 3 protein, partial [Flavobacterium sp.]|nr:glycoside hydrolase family 3 protein [Flavobacterium sp.]